MAVVGDTLTIEVLLRNPSTGAAITDAVSGDFAVTCRRITSAGGRSSVTPSSFAHDANGVYYATVASALEGNYSAAIVWDNESDPAQSFVWSEKVITAAQANPATADDVVVTVAGEWLEAAVPGSFTQGTAGYALGRLGAGAIQITAPTWNAVPFELIAGDDYKAADGRAIDFTEHSVSMWPDLTDATVQLVVSHESLGGFTVDGSVVEATAYPKRVRFELEASDTQGRRSRSSAFRYAVRATLSGSDNVVTLATGHLKIVPPTE